jgi:hypothetical protein
MNASNFAHAAYGLLFQVVIGLLTGDWWAGAAAGAFFFIGREHAQAEYRWIDTFGAGKRSNLPELGGLDRRVWLEIDPWLDWIVPAVACVGMACVIQYGRGW